jgi:hypothetical protein
MEKGGALFRGESKDKFNSSLSEQIKYRAISNLLNLTFTQISLA